MTRVDDFRLRLGEKELVPIMVGGMGVDISAADLALEAARLGGVGHISDAMVDRDDDLRICMKTSAITLGQWDVAAVMAFYVLHLAIWSWVVSPVLSGWGWWLGVAVAAVQVLWHWRLIHTRTREGCFKAFRLNHWVGMALFCGIVVAYR